MYGKTKDRREAVEENIQRMKSTAHANCQTSESLRCKISNSVSAIAHILSSEEPKGKRHG